MTAGFGIRTKNWLMAVVIVVGVVAVALVGGAIKVVAPMVKAWCEYRYV